MRTHTIIGTLILSTTFILGACEKSQPQPPLTGPTRVAPEAPKATPGVVPDATQMPPGHPPVGGPAATPAATADPAATGPVFAALGVNLKLPEGWKRNPPANQMRLGEAVAPDASNDPAKSALVVFSTAGGSIEENIARWSTQVRDAAGMPVPPKSETKTIEGMAVTVVEMTGTFSGMGVDGARTNWTLRGAVVQAPEGLLFIKMTGPAETMAAQAANFTALVGSLKKS